MLTERIPTNVGRPKYLSSLLAFIAIDASALLTGFVARSRFDVNMKHDEPSEPSETMLTKHEKVYVFLLLEMVILGAIGGRMA